MVGRMVWFTRPLSPISYTELCKAHAALMLIGRCGPGAQVYTARGEDLRQENPTGCRSEAATEAYTLMMMMMMMKLPILPCAEKLELVWSTAPKT